MQTNRRDLCQIILPPGRLDPRDIREIILPPDPLRRNVIKVIMPGRANDMGSERCVFTFQPLDGPVVRFFFWLYTSQH